MASNVKVIGGPSFLSDKDAKDFCLSNVVVITYVPPGHSGVDIGSVAIRGVDSTLYFINSGQWCHNCKGYRARALRPGETVTLEGK